MDLTNRAKKAAAIAMATTGLSSCKNGGGIGAVDPSPPALQCSTVGDGKTFEATAQRVGDTVTVTIRERSGIASQFLVDSITGVTGAMLAGFTPPANGTLDPLRVRLTVPSGNGQASFTLNARLRDLFGTTCTSRRTFTVTSSAGGVTVALSLPDEMPLEARQRAEIVVVARAPGKIQLEGRTPWTGERTTSWEVTAGSLDVTTGDRVWWTLPETPGIHQAELVQDYGRAGFAFDVFAIEVT